MSEKKTVSRTIAIELGIICVVLALGLGGAVANYTSIIRKKDNTITSLNSQIEEKNNTISSLKSQIAELKSQIAEKNITISSLNLQIAIKDSQIKSLRSQIDTLNDAITSLSSAITDKNSEISSLKSTIAKLNDAYLSLKSEYDSVKQDYEKLLSAVEKSEVVAKSATWLSEDKRLSVTSEVIPEFFFGELSSYTVKVTVTNVGTEPLSRVYIFLFPYKDGKFAEKYWSTYYSTSVENLYMGESYSYNFTWVSKEMTTYKIIAVAG